jgi:hypothetical protein
VEQSRRKTEMEDPALSPGCCSTRRTEQEGAAGDIVWGTERPGQSCLVAGLPDVGKKDNKIVLASLEECTCRPTSK